MQPTPRTPPGHPGDPGSEPSNPTPVTQTVYGMTVYLKSQRENNPSGIGVKVLAPDPDTARTIINDAFGDDISTVSGPVTITDGVYTQSGSSALGTASTSKTSAQAESVPPEHAHPSGTSEHKKR